MAFDSVDNEMLLFGGRNPTKVFGDTWALNSAQWTNVTPSPLTATNSPSHRYKSAMTYDSSDGYVLLFGGLTSSSAVSSGLNDTWRYESGHWSQVATTAAPSPRCSSAMSFDSTMDAVTLFGGSNQTGATFNDTWSYSAGQWINLSKNLSEIPPGRSMSSLALSTGAGTSGPYLLMFGGQLANGAVLGDTWLGGALPVQFVALRSTSTLLDAGQFLNLSAVAYGGLLPYTYTWNGLPAGCVSLNSSYIGCYPSKAEQYSVQVTVTGAKGSGALTASVSVTVNSRPSVLSFILTPSSTSIGQGNVTFTVKTSGGTGHLNYTFTGLPPGCPNETTSVFNCAPNTTGTYTIFVNVTDRLGVTNGSSATLQVGPASRAGNGWLSRLSNPVVEGGIAVGAVIILLFVLWYAQKPVRPAGGSKSNPRSKASPAVPPQSTSPAAPSGPSPGPGSSPPGDGPASRKQ